MVLFERSWFKLSFKTNFIIFLWIRDETRDFFKFSKKYIFFEEKKWFWSRDSRLAPNVLKPCSIDLSRWFTYYIIIWCWIIPFFLVFCLKNHEIETNFDQNWRFFWCFYSFDPLEVWKSYQTRSQIKLYVPINILIPFLIIKSPDFDKLTFVEKYILR